MKKHRFVVTIKTDECTQKEVEAYVRDAVKTWKGQMHPDDPMFQVLRSFITVKKFKEPKK